MAGLDGKAYRGRLTLCIHSQEQLQQYAKANGTSLVEARYHERFGFLTVINDAFTINMKYGRLSRIFTIRDENAMVDARK